MSSGFKQSHKRILKDRLGIMNEPDYKNAFNVNPNKVLNFNENGETYYEEDMFHWEGYIIGVDDTPYSGGHFKVDITFTNNYPMEPPNILFKTKIFHPNISENGMICLSILRQKPQGEWTAGWDLGKILLAIRSLLASPNPDDPLNINAGNLYKTDKAKFEAQALSFTKRYALPKLVI